MSPGLRDPLGLDGSEPPRDPEAMGRALRHQLRRIQPGLAFVLDKLAGFREKHDPRAQGHDEKGP
jgi:hypothetical protein